MENNRSREDRQMKIGEIRDLLQAAEDQMLPDFIARFESDERSGVPVSYTHLTLPTTPYV